MFRKISGFFTFALVGAAACVAAENPYLEPLRVKGFEARAVAFEAPEPGAPPQRLKPRLGVEIQVQVEDYLPRALEPVLLINGEPVAARSRIVGVEGGVTILGFLIESPSPLKEGAQLAVQMGDETRTRSGLPGDLKLEAIRPLDPAETRRLGLPDLKTWLRGAGEERPQ